MTIIAYHDLDKSVHFCVDGKQIANSRLVWVGGRQVTKWKGRENIPPGTIIIHRANWANYGPGDSWDVWESTFPSMGERIAK